MQSRCRAKAGDSPRFPRRMQFLVVLSAVAIAGSFCGIATAQSNDSGAQTPGQSGSGSMSDRFKKYMPDQPGGAGQPGGTGGGDDMGSRRQRMREKFMNMPDSEKQKIRERMRQRGRFGPGMSGEGGPPDGPPDGPPGGPGGRGFEDGMPLPPGASPGMGGPGEGGLGRFREGWRPGEMGQPGGQMGGKFGGGKGVRNYRRGGADGAKGSKLFGRGPLDLTVLNLSEDQKSKIQTMRTANSQKAKQVQMQLKQRRGKLQEMMFDPASTPDQIKAAHGEIRKLHNQAEDIMINDFLGIRALLTKDQMQLLPQVRPEPASRMRPRGTARGPGSDGPGLMAREGRPPGPPTGGPPDDMDGPPGGPPGPPPGEEE